MSYLGIQFGGVLSTSHVANSFMGTGREWWLDEDELITTEEEEDSLTSFEAAVDETGTAADGRVEAFCLSS